MKVELTPEAFGALVAIVEQAREDFVPSRHAIDYPTGITAKLEAKFNTYLDEIEAAFDTARNS